MRAIVSVTSDWAIGCEGRLLVRNKADMRRFVELTMGGTVLMAMVQILLHRFTLFGDAYTGNRLSFTVKNGYDFNSALEEQLKAWGAQVADSTMTRRKDGTTEYELTIRRKKALSYAEIKEFMMEREDVLSVSNSPLSNQY